MSNQPSSKDVTIGCYVMEGVTYTSHEDGSETSRKATAEEVLLAGALLSTTDELRGCSRELAIERRAAQRAAGEPPAEPVCEWCGGTKDQHDDPSTFRPRASQPPRGDHCEVCDGELPHPDEWSMPSCPDCQEVLGFLGELMADYADREREGKAKLVSSAIKLICRHSRAAQPSPPAREPDGHAYRFRSPDGAGTFLSLHRTGRIEPIETIPYWLDTPPTPGDRPPVAYIVRRLSDRGLLPEVAMPGDLLKIIPGYEWMPVYDRSAPAGE